MNGNILLIDVNKESLLILRKVCESHFYNTNIRLIAPGSDNLDICLTYGGSIVIIDMISAGIHGLHLLQSIKQEAILKHTQLIAIIDVDSREELTPKVIEAGADQVLLKPLIEQECMPVLRRCLRLHELENIMPNDKKLLMERLYHKDLELQKIIFRQRDSEESVRLERDFARQVLNAMGQGLTITNSEGVFQYANPAFSKMVGYTIGELTGKRPHDITDVKSLRTLNHARSLRLKGESSSYEVTTRHKNGHLLDVMVTGVPYFREGKFAGTIASINDITHIKRVTRDLDRIRMEYEHIFNNTQDAMFLISVINERDFRYIRTNRAMEHTTGISPEAIAGKTPREFFGEEIGNTVCRNYSRCVQKRHTIHLEEFSNYTGKPTHWRTTLTPVIEEKKVTLIVGTSTDITLLKELEKQLTECKKHELPEK